MTVLTFGFTAVLAATQGTAAGTECLASALEPASVQLCQGEQAAKRAEGARDRLERTRLLEAAAESYRRAADLGQAGVRLRALTALAATYEPARLDDAGRREVVLRELVALTPLEPRFAFELAALQESQGFADAAEETLLGARQRHPDHAEPFKVLAQFYARRASALLASTSRQTPAPPAAPGESDDNGIYQVGGPLAAPPRVGMPQYPLEAQAAGIQGSVQAEIVINPEGRVSDARIVKSIPLLDEAALKAVREWRYEPTHVDGKPVPVRMVVTVNFTLTK